MVYGNFLLSVLRPKVGMMVMFIKAGQWEEWNEWIFEQN